MEPEHERVDWPLAELRLSVTVVGDKVQVRPVEDEDTTARDTVPAYD